MKGDIRHGDFFVYALASGQMMLGCTTEGSLMAWAQKGHALTLRRPRLVQYVPPNPGNPNGGIGYGPCYPLGTPQEEMLVIPISVDIIGKVKVVEGQAPQVTPIAASGNKNIGIVFGDYMRALDQWWRDLSEIEQPPAPKLVLAKS
jgi:hypothetical protein